MKLRKILFAVITVGVVLSVNYGSVYANDTESIVKESESKVDKLEDKKKKIKDDIENKEASVEELLLHVELLNDDKLIIESEIEKSERDIIKTEKRIKKIEEEVKELQESIDKRMELVGDKLIRYQIEGKIDYLDVLLGSDSFMNFVDRAHTVSVIMKADNDIVEELLRDLETVQEKLKEVRDLKKDLEDVKKDQENKKVELENNIKKTKDSKKKLDKEVKKLNTSTKDIEKEQDKLIDKINKELGMKVGLGKGKLEWPTDGGRISSGVGSRTHPITGSKRVHKGVDIARSDKSKVPNIYAAEDGTVTFSGRSGGYGNMIKISHEDGLVTHYAHLSELDVKIGQSVRRGQKIGIMGTTGSSTGIHLHFETFQDGNLQNPLRYIK